MIYNEKTESGLYKTIINIENNELIPLQRAIHEYILSNWFVEYIDNHMKVEMKPKLVARYYFLKYLKAQELNIAKSNLSYSLNEWLNGKCERWDFNGIYTTLTLYTTEEIEVPDEVMKRAPRLMVENYNEGMIRLYNETWETGSVNKTDTEKGEKTVPIRTCTMQITEACNLRCTYCYQINKKENSVMTLETAKKFVDLIMDATEETPYLATKNTHGVIFDFIGGEAFVEVDLMEQICEYIVNKLLLTEHRWLFTTKLFTGSNGTLYMTDRIQEFLNKWTPMFSTSITLDGCREVHDACRVFPDGSGSYDLALEATRKLREKNKNISSKITISPDNLPMMAKAIINMVEEGYTDIHSNPVFEEGWEMEHAIMYYKQLKDIADYFIEHDLYRKVSYIEWKEDGIGKLPDDDNANWCGGSGGMIAVNPSGKIYPCIRYTESSVGDDAPPFIIGDVEKGLLHTEEQKEIVKNLVSITRSSQSTQECMDCPVNMACAWCTAYNYQRFGTPNHRATFICWLHKATVLANTYYWNIVRAKYPSFGYPFILQLPDEDALKIISRKELEHLKEFQYYAIKAVNADKEITFEEYPEKIRGKFKTFKEWKENVYLSH